MSECKHRAKTYIVADAVPTDPAMMATDDARTNKDGRGVECGVLNQLQPVQ
jgi:hypothetical protein